MQLNLILWLTVKDVGKILVRILTKIPEKLAKEYANECVFPSITVKVNIRSWFYMNSWLS